MKLSVVLATRGRAEMAFKCAQRLLEVTDSVELIISAHPEQENIDAFRPLLSDKRVLFYSREVGNALEAWNYGIQYAQGDLLMPLDDDRWMNPDWHKEAIEKADISIPMYLGIGHFTTGVGYEGHWPEIGLGTRRFFTDILGGVLCVPHYKSHHDDVEKADKARASNCIFKVNGSIEHKIPWDATRALGERWHREDFDMYHKRKVLGFPLDYEPIF